MIIPRITAESLAALPGVAHAFFTRKGGVSDGLYASLNCGPGSADTAGHVRENRARAAARLGLGGDHLVTCYQVHSDRVVTVEAPWTTDAPPRADALVSRRPGLALGVLAADCAPVLFAAPDAGVVGAAHAGWKGALGGVLEATVAAMVELGARAAQIRAAVGPCIAQTSYEVGPDFPAPLLEQDPANAAFFRTHPDSGRPHFDLAGYARRRLEAAGVEAVELLGLDTYADEARFFSYRRNCHRGERDYGRLLSAIALASREAGA